MVCSLSPAKFRLAVVILILGAAMSDAPAKDAPKAKAPTFAGHWTTTYGPMALRATPGGLQGYYVMEGGHGLGVVSGKIEGDRYAFTYNERGLIGEGWFKLAADGKSFAGKWRPRGASQWADWIGKRTAGPSPKSYAGLWSTSYGKMRLAARGSKIAGIYGSGGGSSIEGDLKDGKFIFQYKERTATGEGWFRLSDDALRLEGQWREKGGQQWRPWTARRIQAAAGQQWLVVLETHWEKDLGEQDYSFGAMLRAFFSRSPHVRVRHRFFSDEAGFRRWSREIAYLPGPVVLSVAAHGQATGVVAGGKIIDARSIIHDLRHCTNLKLIHFSSCQIMRGDVTDKKTPPLARRADFAISGYTTSVDWAASAVIEFMYFDLILNRGYSPSRAAEQLTRLMPFAKDQPVPGTAMRAAGFKIWTPAKEAPSNGADRAAINNGRPAATAP